MDEKDFVTKREKNYNVKEEIGPYTLFTKWFTREKLIQILTQTLFLMTILGRLMLDSL